MHGTRDESAAESERVRAHVIITGRVQGVYFRAATKSSAESCGVAGWVRNRGQDVEAVFEGSRRSVERVIAWCHEGPPHAAVDGVRVSWETPQGLSGFDIRPTLI